MIYFQNKVVHTYIHLYVSKISKSQSFNTKISFTLLYTLHCRLNDYLMNKKFS